MSSYDILFIGHMAVDEIHHFGGEVTIGTGGAVFCGALAAARVGRKVAVVTRMAITDEHMVDDLRLADVDVFITPAPATTYVQVIHPSADMDKRKITQISNAGFFNIEEIPDVQARVFNIAGISDREFNLSILQNLKIRGARLAADMQSFVRQVDAKTGRINFQDVKDKSEIFQLLTYAKLDVVEAEVLTGTRDPEQAARKIAEWGTSEIVITRSDGVFTLAQETAHFVPFTNQSEIGRTGRGDTVLGAYLAWRPEHSVQESLEFAAALVSIKMESLGPFNGTLNDVNARLKN